MREDLDLRRVLKTLTAGETLDRETVGALFAAIMDGALPDVHLAAVLTALRTRGETAVELAAAARAMRERAVPVVVGHPDAAVDTCGTGGDGADTINVSTAAALVAAAGRVPVAKHGNRSVSSKCGSADVLEALGVRLALPAEALAALVDDLGIAFLFAPPLHPAMKAVMPVRRALGVRTIFNMLGPLTNPARVQRQVVGVWGSEIQDLMAGALAELGAKHALIVHSDDGLDEISVGAPTRVVEVVDGQIVRDFHVTPAGLGIAASSLDALRGGDVAFNARRLEEVLAGERSAASEAVAANAGAALYVGSAVNGLAEGVKKARDILADGRGLALLRKLVRRSGELGNDG
ncbi:MAG: anthranilate phosphoribosyltransferase [Nitrospiraceae bacterium]|nr:anthranilate phosphoribosyltransferase [Nitrospiraceae bacterium]